jgi:hypothetical protein
MFDKDAFSVRTAFVFSVLIAACAISEAQQSSNPKRIELRAKGTPVVLEGEVSKKSEVVYIFSAKAGQRFNGRITRKDGNIGFDVTDPDGEALPEEEHDFNSKLIGSLKKTGDYKITVSSFEERVGKFSLSVKLD